MVITNIHATNQGQRSINSNNKMETNKQMGRETDATDHSNQPPLTQLVKNKFHHKGEPVSMIHDMVHQIGLLVEHILKRTQNNPQNTQMP